LHRLLTNSTSSSICFRGSDFSFLSSICLKIENWVFFKCRIIQERNINSSIKIYWVNKRRFSQTRDLLDMWNISSVKKFVESTNFNSLKDKSLLNLYLSCKTWTVSLKDLLSQQTSGLSKTICTRSVKHQLFLRKFQVHKRPVSQRQNLLDLWNINSFVRKSVESTNVGSLKDNLY